MPMKPIEIYSNWCNFDRLDGKDLKDGENLRIQWPDGSVTLNVIKVRKSEYPYNDMGVQTTIPESKAYVEVLYRGLLTEVRIHGLQAERL